MAGHGAGGDQAVPPSPGARGHRADDHPAGLRLLADADLALVLHEQARRPLAGVAVPSSGTIAVVVGPEGGLTDGEVLAFRAAGAQAVRLGQEVLRTSTAGAAALAALSVTTRWS